MQKKELNLVIQGNYGYGYGWEDVSSYPCGERQKDYYEQAKLMRHDLKEYRASGHGIYRVIQRYEDFISC